MMKKVTVAVPLVVSMLMAACGGGGSGRVGTGAGAGVPADLASRGALLGSLRAALLSDGNLLANPGFESGIAGWSDWGNTAVVDGTGASGTLRALRVGTAAGGAGQEVAVTPGVRYRLGGAVRVSAAAESVVVGINMVDQYGTKVAEEAVLITNTSYSLAQVEITAPSNAARALVYVWKNAGPGYAFVDELTFGSANAPAQDAGNLIANGGFETGLEGWQNWGNAAAVTGQSSSGSYAVRVGTGAGGVGNVVGGIQSGKAYHLSGQVKVSDPSEFGYLGVAFLDALGAHLLEQNVPVNSTAYTVAQLDLVAPANADRALVYLWKNAGGGYADAIALTAAAVTAAPPPAPAPTPAPTPAPPAPAPSPAPSPAPTPAPAPVTDFGVVSLGSWPNTMLQVGRSTDAYWVEDGVWAPAGLTRGNFTTIDGTNFEQYTGVSRTVGPNGEVAARIAWKWPTCCTEIKSFPSIIAGQKPGYFNTWTTPGGFNVRLPDGSISQTYPSGRTPGTFFPLQLPIASLKTSFALKHMSPPTGRGHLAYDMYLQSTPTQYNGFGTGVTHEIIVPVDYWGGYGTYPTRNPNWYDHDVTIDGILYHVYIYKDETGWVLSSFSGGWKFIVFEPDRPIPPGTLDLAKIVNYVSTRKDVFGIPWATGNEYLTSVELGVEPQFGTGDIQVNNFRVWR